MSANLNTQQRRERILGAVYEFGQVEVKSLATVMDISEATVRRDLRALADGGQVTLFYGGASLPTTSDFSFRAKATRNVSAKRTIGRLAAGLVVDHETLFIDGGTTSLEIAPHLKRLRGLSIIVNSLRLAAELGGTPGHNLIMVGGQYRADRMDNVGPLAISALEQLRGFKAFIGADGLSRDFGVTAGDIESAHLHQLAIRNARETILLADHTKLASPSLYKITDFDSISRIITDRKPGAEWIEFFAEQKIELVYPNGENSTAEEADDAESEGEDA